MAIAALGGVKTIGDIAHKYDVHPIQVTDWRRQLLERAASVFGATAEPAQPAVDLNAMHAKDWQSRQALAHRVSITTEASFFVEALNEAVARYGPPEIVNTDHSSQFGSAEFVDAITACRAQQSMDGRGCWRNNVFVERLWRSVKDQVVYLKALRQRSRGPHGPARCFESYNARRPHRAHGGRTPDRVCFAPLKTVKGGRPEHGTRVAHRVGRAFVAGDARPQPIHLSHPRVAFKGAEPTLYAVFIRDLTPLSHLMIERSVALVGHGAQEARDDRKFWTVVVDLMTPEATIRMGLPMGHAPALQARRCVAERPHPRSCGPQPRGRP